MVDEVLLDSLIGSVLRDLLYLSTCTSVQALAHLFCTTVRAEVHCSRLNFLPPLIALSKSLTLRVLRRDTFHTVSELRTRSSRKECTWVIGARIKCQVAHRIRWSLNGECNRGEQ